MSIIPRVPQVLGDLFNVDESDPADANDPAPLGGLLVPDGVGGWEVLEPANDDDLLVLDSTAPLGLRWVEQLDTPTQAQVGPWIYDDVEADLTNEPLWLLDGARAGVPLCVSHRIECVVVRTDSPRTAGTLTVKVTVNDVPIDMTGAVLNAASPQCSSDEVDVVAGACEMIGASVTTSSDWEPIDANITVMILWRALLMYPGIGGGALAREEVIFGGGEMEDGGALAREEVVSP
jgi:hypothetical protein